MNKKEPKLKWYQKIWEFIDDNIWVYPINIIFSPKLNIRRIKFLYQRITRGWDDSQTWNLDYEIAKFIVPRLKRFKEITIGVPCNLPSFNIDQRSEDADKKAEKEWDDILDKMIKGFEWLLKEDDWVFDSYSDPSLTDKAKYEEYKKRQRLVQKEVTEGLNLFKIYYRNLWW
jgi:hypothetical protein